MPFTFAHPAAVLPLARPLGRWGCMSALVIGSMAPDFSYFIPLDIDRGFSHSMQGIIGFGLPAGLLVYVLYHLLMKQPLLALLPASIAGKAASLLAPSPLWPPVSIGIVAINILLGACTHVAWDSFTPPGRCDGVGHSRLAAEIVRPWQLPDSRLQTAPAFEHRHRPVGGYALCLAQVACSTGIFPPLSGAVLIPTRSGTRAAFPAAYGVWALRRISCLSFQ